MVLVLDEKAFSEEKLVMYLISLVTQLVLTTGCRDGKNKTFASAVTVSMRQSDSPMHEIA